MYKFVQHTSPEDQDDYKGKKRLVYLFTLWEDATRYNSGTQLVSGLEDCEVDENLGEFSPKYLYYIAGWLLNHLVKVKGNDDADARVAFVKHNRITPSDNGFQTETSSGESGDLSSLLEYREKKEKALTRSGLEWFRFIKLMEALYIVNLTPQNKYNPVQNFSRS